MRTLRKAISIVGGVSALARAVGVSNQAVYGWLSGQYEMMARHAAVIEDLTQGQVMAGDIGRELIAMRHQRMKDEGAAA
jgi:DNA-binding transcriptional regulator YdaS (Cro superfamily)